VKSLADKKQKKLAQNRRRKNLVAPSRARRKRLSGWLFGSFILAVTSVALYAIGSTAQKAISEIADRPIAAVEITGELDHVSVPELQTMLEPLINQQFLSIDLQLLKKQLEQQPWIAQATLSRRWPDRLHVALVEETAIARWRDTSFLNQAGEEIWLGDNQLLNHLPKLSGPKQSHLEVAKKFVEINSTIQPLHLSVQELVLNEDLSWQVELNNHLLIKLGRDQLVEKMERFVAVYETTLQPKVAEIETVDLRYRNGVAVQWLPQEISAAN